MSVRVRLFAALRDAAGTGEVELQSGPVAALVEELRARFGEPFATRVTVASVLLDGDPVARDSTVPAPDGAELALLPPVSGGQGTAPSPGWASPPA